MQATYDIAAIDQAGVMPLAVVVKAKWGTNAEWASQWRRNLAVHSSLPGATFFLMALPDRFYLWMNKEEASRQIWLEPDLVIDPTPMLAPYFERIGIKGEALHGETFEFILLTWLNDVIDASSTDIPLNAAGQWLEQSGLYNALRNTRVVLPEIA